MKRKLFWVLGLTIVMLCVLAISASAFTVSYDGQSYTQATNENGEVTLRDTMFGNASSTSKFFFGWYTLEGDMYAPGETITIAQDIKLYQAYGYKGTKANLPIGGDGSSSWEWPFIQLQEDIVLESHMAPPWGGCATVDLNGYTITTSAENAVSQQRGGIRFVGKGEIIHTGTGNFFNCSTHGYGDGSQYLLIGKYVKVITDGTLFNYTNNVNSNIPVAIYGDVTCRAIAHISGFGAGKIVTFTINPKRLKLTGDTFITCGTYPETSQMLVNITGGTLVLPSSANSVDYWNNSKASAYTITVSGGVFNNGGSALSGYIPSTHALSELAIDGATYAYVSEKTDCTHSYSQVSTEKATCILYAKSNQKCTLCGDTVTAIYGDLYDHSWTLTEEILATPTEPGLRIYDCDTCDKIKEAVFYYDPNDLIINVGTTSGVVQALVSDVLNLIKAEDEYEGVTYTVAGVKSFDEYELADIISIEIPAGVTNANFILKNKYLQKITILDSVNLRFTKFTNLEALTEIEIKGATVKFVEGCSNNAIKGIYSNTPGAKISFEAKAFDGKTNLERLTLCAGSEYEFGSVSFRNTGIKELIIPDGCSPIFKTEGAFYGAAIEYLYIGTGNKELNGKPFDCCGKLKTIILMDVETMNMEWNFCVANEVTTLLEVYIHSDKISLPKNTFYKRTGIVVYTSADLTNAEAFNECKSYTIVKGIPHKLVPGTIEPTCTEHGISGYITDCPCGKGLIGEVETKIFNSVITNSESFTTETYTSYKVDALGHNEGEITNIEYKNGYDNFGTKTAVCLRCHEVYTEENPTADKIYIFLGYSSNKDFTELAIGFMFDVTAMETYEKITGKTFAYGVVGAITLALDGKVPHEAQGRAVFAEFERGTSYVTYRVKGFNKELHTLGITISAYARVTKDGITEYYYIQDSQTQSPKSYTLAEYIASLPPEEIV